MSGQKDDIGEWEQGGTVLTGRASYKLLTWGKTKRRGARQMETNGVKKLSVNRVTGNENK